MMPHTRQAMIVLQAITVSWTKRSRGMPGAAKRNAVPEAWPVPDEGGCALLLQEVRFSEYRDFTDPLVTVERDPGAERLHAAYRLEFERTDAGLAVYFRGDPLRPQYPGPRKVFTLGAGEWARLISNGREPLEDTWAYARHICNIGVTTGRAEECFTHGRQLPGYTDEVQLL